MDYTKFVALGFIFILIGFILIFIGALGTATNKSRIEYGGVIFIGPIPLVSFGSSKELVKLILIISAILMIAFLVFYKI